MELEVGTIEELETEPEKKRKISPNRFNGGNGSNNGKRGGGGGGGDDRSDDKNEELDQSFKPDKYKVSMGLVLLVVLMTFGALFGTYIVLATNKALEWRPFTLPLQIWVSTALIIVSSIDYELAKNSLLQGNQIKARKWFLITAFVGMIFIASQMLAWFNLVNLGYYATGNSYAGLFYILTAVHAVHVFGGIISLVYIVIKTRSVTMEDEELLKRQWFAKVIGWYWHFMGILWAILFLLLGFYK